MSVVLVAAKVGLTGGSCESWLWSDINSCWVWSSVRLIRVKAALPGARAVPILRANCRKVCNRFSRSPRVINSPSDPEEIPESHWTLNWILLQLSGQLEPAKQFRFDLANKFFFFALIVMIPTLTRVQRSIWSRLWWVALLQIDDRLDFLLISGDLGFEV